MGAVVDCAQDVGALLQLRLVARVRQVDCAGALGLYAPRRTKAVPWHQGRPSITVIPPQKALQLETLLGVLGGTPSRRRQTLTSDFKFSSESHRASRNFCENLMAVLHRRWPPSPCRGAAPCGLHLVAGGVAGAGAGRLRMPRGRCRPAIAGRPHRRPPRRRASPAPFFLADCGGSIMTGVYEWCSCTWHIGWSLCDSLCLRHRTSFKRSRTRFKQGRTKFVHSKN
jgi:hypothetical protein